MVGQINVDFNVRSDLYHLFIDDLSCWGISEELPAVIEITLPGKKKPFKDYFTKQDTAYNSISLGLSCGDECEKIELPDGVYHIKIKASPETFYKEYYYLKADKLMSKIDIALINNINGGVECLDSILEANTYLEVARASVFNSDIRKGKEYYDYSLKLVSRIVECKTCK